MSEKIITTFNDFEFITHAESSNFETTPNYDETLEFIKKLSLRSKYAKIVNFGTSHAGRSLYAIILSSSEEFGPKKNYKNRKLKVFIQAGIHPGEIEGKDALQIILREILITKELEYLLDRLTLVIIPVFNPDGHERRGEFNRPNQIGPHLTGWRTNALNKNLNRDYLKADTAEMRSFLRFFNEWLPDFYIDSHTTNGMDYRYHVSYSVEKHQNIDRKLAGWGKDVFVPSLIKSVEERGFLISPYPEYVDDDDITKGITNWGYEPRYSTGYAAIQNRLGLLIEAHSLKTYKERVLVTKEVIISSLDILAKNAQEVRFLNYAADKFTVKKYFEEKKRLPVLLEGDEEKQDEIIFKGYKVNEKESLPFGKTILEFDKSVDVDYVIPFYNYMKVDKLVQAPGAYIIPRELKKLIKLLKLHGIKYFRNHRDIKAQVEKYKFEYLDFSPRSLEGRQRCTFEYYAFEEEVEILEGSYIVPVNQRTLKVILNLFEPAAPDSLVRWGFFNAFFERKEYAESFIFNKIAEEMLESDPQLKEEFELLLAEDEEFRDDPVARLDFFYTHSKYMDKNELVYPIMRLHNPEIYFDYFRRK